MGLPVKVLLISPRVTGIGGIAQHVAELAQRLRGRGFRVDVISCENTLHIPVKGLMNPSFALTSALKTYFKIPYPPEPYDVVHAHSLPSALAMKAAWANRRILTLHGAYSEGVKVLHGTLLGRGAAWFEAKAFKWADRVSVVSKRVKEYYAAKGFRNVEYIPNAINVDGLAEGEVKLYGKQVIYAGRLSREKGLDLLIEAFKLLPEDYHLLIVGEGPQHHFLERIAKDYKRIHFLGYKPRDEVIRLLRGSNAFVLPSRQEGLSTVILEAMAVETPVIATSVGGNVELVKHGETGLLVPPENPKAIAEAIRLVVENDDLARTLTSTASIYVAKNYSWEAVLDKYLKLYTD